jgi:geranylgeranyl transferase type-2 subunit beta
MLFLQ